MSRENKRDYSGKEKNTLESRAKRTADNAEHCICCGAVIPEGREVCPTCEALRYKDEKR